MILIFGSRGQLAQSFKAVVPAHLDGQTVFVSSQDANFLEPVKLAGLLDHYSPQVIINCAAYTMVDQAEVDFDIAEGINAKAPQEIARWASKNEALFIHFSSDYVYSGQGTEPWIESSEVQPINKYGETKAHGDEAIRNTACRHFIFRTSWVYSEYGNNFLKKMLKLARSHRELRIVDDQVGSPTYAPTLAKTVWQIVDQVLQNQKYPSGIYHLTNSGYVSWADFAIAIFDDSKKNGMDFSLEKVAKIPTKEFPTPAMRPLNSRLNNTKFERTFGLSLPSWQDDMRLCIRRLKALS